MPDEKPNKRGKFRKSGKRGETTREIIRLLINKPRVSIQEIADSLSCTYENVRVAFEKLKEKPESAILFGFDEEAVRSAIACRSTKAAQKRETIWRGKANWPAAKTATKKSLSARELFSVTRTAYEFKDQKFVLSGLEKERSKVYMFPLAEISDPDPVKISEKNGKASVPATVLTVLW